MSATRSFAGGVLALVLWLPVGAAEPAEGADGRKGPAPSLVSSAEPMMEAMDVSRGQMAALMGMDDGGALGKVMLDQLEWAADDDRTAAAWDAQAWYGTDYSRLWIKSEGERATGSRAEARTELLLDHIVGRWWSWQAGLRYDLGNGPARGWTALGIQGLAPYGFDIEATAYLGDAGRTAARFRAEHDLLVTQRLILQPEFETNLYGKADSARGIGSGLADLQLALRLRYEIRREVAPYVGLAWRRALGATAQFKRTGGGESNALEWVAGIHIWF